MSRAQIEKITAELLDNTMDVEINNISKDKDNILRFEATFIKQTIHKSIKKRNKKL